MKAGSCYVDVCSHYYYDYDYYYYYHDYYYYYHDYYYYSSCSCCNYSSCSCCNYLYVWSVTPSAYIAWGTLPNLNSAGLGFRLWSLGLTRNLQAQPKPHNFTVELLRRKM